MANELATSADPAPESPEKRSKAVGFLGPVLYLPFLAVCAVILGFVPILVIGTNQFAWSQADPFGVVNAFVSALAFGAVIVSLWYQKHELTLQHEELMTQTQELRHSIQQYKKMAEAQESSDKRLFLTAYLNILTTLQELNTTRFEINYALDISLTFAAVSQRRMKLTLNRLLPALHDELMSLYRLTPEKHDLQNIVEEIVTAIDPVTQFAALHSQDPLPPNDVIPLLEEFKTKMQKIADVVPMAVSEKIRSICNSVSEIVHRLRIGDKPPGGMSEWGHIWQAMRLAKDVIIDFLKRE